MGNVGAVLGIVGTACAAADVVAGAAVEVAATVVGNTIPLDAPA